MRRIPVIFLLSALILLSCTSNDDGIPSLSILKTNSNSVGKYEKFEISLDLQKVNIKNPYDPGEIDLYADFRSPEGKTIRINGFYDDYQKADIWKIRFSPGITGNWSYRVFAKNMYGTGDTGDETFTCVDSDHHGWIRPSGKNSHYFVHDDGTSWYPVGVYSPWRNDKQRLNNYVQHKANLLALWDITYGGFVNGTGLIEEELGRYNQEKCGRIDSLLSFLEQHDMKLMFAIWPHDLFSKTVWAHQWDNNPLRKVTDVENVYSDSAAWEYQKRKYRYLIARFSYSGSFGIWELINEMNGTDGWAKGHQQEAYDWVEKAQQYFTENDPYRHPMTASFSGGFTEYRPPLYERIDIPNIHLYEKQGWAMKYPGDTLRSSMYDFAWASRRFWDNFDKPAIFGEAGAELAWYKKGDPTYDIMYHNDIWASLASGLAGIPVWWDYTFITDNDWDHLQYLSEFVKDIDFANEDFKPAEIQATGSDAFAMVSEQGSFGWARHYNGNNISGEKLLLSIPDGNYEIKWFDTRNGKYVKMDRTRSVKNVLAITAPSLQDPARDIAFKIRKD